MDEIEQSILAAWTRIRPRLVDDPAEYCRRLSRRVSLRSPPRAWCLAIRATDTRLNHYCSNIPDPSRSHQLILDKPALWKLCSPVKLESPGEPIIDVAAKLGVSRGSLLNSRVKGLFKTHHIHGPGRPQPLLYTDQPLDPTARGFICADPIWTWTATFLPCYLPDDHPPQTLTRIAHFHARGRHLRRDTSELHPEHPDVDPVRMNKRSLALPPPAPDHVAYKWKDGVYMGYDWRNPRAAAGYLKHEQQKAKSRAAQKARRRAHPKPSKASGSLEFRGWKWLCPKCNKPVNVLFLPVPPMNLLTDEVRRPKDANQKSQIANQKSAGFACKSCHRVRYTSGTKKSAWGEIIAYLSGGLLYGNEVPRPDCLRPHRKYKYSPRINRQPSVRRPQIEKLLLAGKSIQKIASELRLSKGTILFYCKQIYPQHGVKCLRHLLDKYGIDVPRNLRGPARGNRGEGRVPRPKAPPRVIAREQVRTRILAGETPTQIAASLNLSRQQLLDHLSKLRRAGRIPTELRLRKRGISSGVRSEIRRRIKDGQSTARIVKDLGVTQRAVYNQRWVMKKQHSHEPAVLRTRR